MKNFTYLLALFISYHSYSQSGDCEGRYQNEIFSDVDIETVIYSEPYNLEMDIYTPEGDVCNNQIILNDNAIEFKENENTKGFIYRYYDF